MKRDLIKEINREAFARFKRVRQLHHPLYGDYLLYSKNGSKFMGKQLPSGSYFTSFRNALAPVYKYSGQNDTYFFPLQGQPVSGLGHQPYSDEIQRWVEKNGSVENCLWSVLRTLLKIVEAGCEEIAMDCVRVHDGQVIYCYDTWMQSSLSIVANSKQQLESYYFSEQDLHHLKNMLQEGEDQRQYYPNKESLYFRVCLLVLCLGSIKMRERNYEFSFLSLNWHHLELRLEYFCSRFNSRGLGSILRQFFEGTCTPSNLCQSILEQKNCNESRKALRMINSESNVRLRTDYSNKESSISRSQLKWLKKSIYSQVNECKENYDNLRKSYNSINKEKRKAKSIEKSSITSLKKPRASNTYQQRSSSKKKYQLYKHPQNCSLKLKDLLSCCVQPSFCQNILSLLGIKEYLPQSAYEAQVMQALCSVHAKPQWKRIISESGAVYFGETQSDKKQGKGIYLTPSNDFYYGGWHHDKMHGYGIYIFMSGQVYEGQLKNGEKSGHGKCLYPDGREYHGSWKANSKVGLGTVKFPNEVSFIGVFRADSQQTEGMFIGPLNEQGRATWQNRGLLESYNWKANQLIPSSSRDALDRTIEKCNSEHWKRLYDGTSFVYQGETKDGLREGFGAQETQEYLYEGQWHNNKREGFGRLSFKTGCSVAGEWKGNIMVRYACGDNQDLF